MERPTGVLVMAYGTPTGPDDVEEYYTHIRRGRPPTPELLAELRGRYEAIGGTSPLAAITRAQADGLAAALQRRHPGGWTMALGTKHAPPFIEDAVAGLLEAGVDRIVGVVLAPHYSRFSVGEYLGRATEAAAGAGVEVRGVESWHLEPAYLDFLAAAVAEGLSRLPERSTVLFTAHSLPERILGTGDPYPDQVRATAEAVAARVGLDGWARWAVAWQSAGRTPEPWLGPDILTVLDHLGSGAAPDRVPGVLVCPCGFVADHLEVLYDLDIEAAGVADRLGLPFARTRSLNDDAAVLDALAARVAAEAGR